MRGKASHILLSKTRVGKAGNRGVTGGGRKGGGPALEPLLARGTSLIRIPELLTLLWDYPDKEAAHYLADGFRHGFRIPVLPPICTTWARNLCSVMGTEAVVHKNITKEVEAGRVTGPFRSPPMPNLQVSPLGVVPKKGAQRELLMT